MGMERDVILETRNLVKAFKGFVAVDGVSLRVRRGEIHALIGPNGAGKTTFFNLLTKFLQPTSGAISYNGEDITRERPAAVARRGVVRSFQICAVFPHLTVLENVRVALQRRLGLVLGLIEGLTKVIYPEASNIVVFVIMAVVLIWRPAGLFGKE
jgi:branched-chain amino acid transport system ATP-binding protein